MSKGRAKVAWLDEASKCFLFMRLSASSIRSGPRFFAAGGGYLPVLVVFGQRSAGRY
jgi:hypothetical protein